MNKIISLSLVILVLISACKNNAGNQIVPPPPAPVQSQPPAAPQPPNLTQASQPAQPANAAAALNPKHGQPGHRCDIPEGAPLNSNVTNPAPQPVNTTSPLVAPPVITQPQKTVRLNPAHGQPGHDCGVPVGQPLKN